jgi:hypothetical protein
MKKLFEIIFGKKKKEHCGCRKMKSEYQKICPKCGKEMIIC